LLGTSHGKEPGPQLQGNHIHPFIWEALTKQCDSSDARKT